GAGQPDVLSRRCRIGALLIVVSEEKPAAKILAFPETSAPEPCWRRSMSIEQDPTIPPESVIEQELDREQTPTSREYERRWWTLGVLCISLVMIVMSNASLNVALPTLANDLHASSSSLQWIVDAYGLVFAGLLLTAGSLGDRYGRRAALNGGLIVFGGASLFAVLSSWGT